MELDELIRSIDIVEYISQYIDLEQRGDEWWGLSCFKNEKTPSFSVRKDPPFFYDYSSAIGGNVFTFILEYNKCSKRDAVEILKQYAGFSGQLSGGLKKMDSALACRRFERRERPQKADKTTILPDDYMQRYEKRPEKLAVWESEGISRETLDKFQVSYDPFSDRLVYPIRNPDGQIVNVGGRTLDPLWKEKDLRKYTYFFKWGTINTIYGISENHDEIEKCGKIILFEGCKSVLLADTWGIHNCGAILTSHLSGNQSDLLIQLGCDVVFALDNDVSILKDKNIRNLRRYLNVEYIHDSNGLLDEKDAPVDKGRDTFLELYDRRNKFRI